MSHYARIRVLAEVADNASYLNPRQHSTEEALTPDEYRVHEVVDAVAAGGTTYHVESFTTATTFIVENTATTGTAYVTVTWKSADTAANTARLYVGDVLCTTDFDPATNPTLVASAGTIPCAITITGT